MRALLISGLILLISTLALALNPASPADKAAIQKLISDANVAQAAVNLAKQQLSATETLLKKNPRDPALLSQRQADVQAVQRLIKDRDLIRDKAIHRTMIAYGISNVDGTGKVVVQSGTSVLSNNKGQKLYWHPISRDDAERISINPDGSRRHHPPVNRPGVAAKTEGDGVSTIYASAFTNPEFLALVLAHEQSHFNQYTTIGGDKKSFNEREAEAWRKTVRDALQLGASPSDQAYFIGIATTTLAYYQKAVEDEQWWERVTLGAKKPSTSALAAPRTVAEREEIANGFDDLSGVVAQEIAYVREEARRQSEEEERKRAAAVPIPLNPDKGTPDGYVPAVPDRSGWVPPARPVPLNPSVLGPEIIYGLMERVAQYACASPEGPIDAPLGGIPWSQFAKVRNIESLESGKSSCEISVLRRLAEFGRSWNPSARLTVEDVRMAARSGGSVPSGGGYVPPSQSHDPVWKRVNPIIR